MSSEVMRQPSRRLSNLDLLRGVAALFVCAGHLRAFLLVDFGKVTSAGVLDRLFYFATGLGHQAVVVFFVLSGYLIGGGVLTSYQGGRWSWTNYAIRRLSRLWIVLLPALILTLVLDNIGWHYRPTGYEGWLASLYNSGPRSDAPADLRVTTFFGNLFFLQTIRVNCFGTNGPLWSLAYEFWYYTLFPLLCGVVFLKPPTYRIACALLAGCLIWWLPLGVLLGGIIWLFGVGAFCLERVTWVSRLVDSWLWLLVVGSLCCASLLASKTSSILGADLSVGAAFAAWVVGLVQNEHRIRWLKALGGALSEMSYTLYTMHFPILAFLFFALIGPKKLQPEPLSYLWFGGLLFLCLALAAALWWCFERHTGRLRTLCEARMRTGAYEERLHSRSKPESCR